MGLHIYRLFLLLVPCLVVTTSRAWALWQRFGRQFADPKSLWPLCFDKGQGDRKIS